MKFAKNTLCLSRIFLLGMLMVLPLASMAQNFTVKAQLKDPQSNESLPFANVILNRTSDTLFIRGGQSDLDGKVTIKDVPARDYILTIKYVGYEPYFANVKVNKDVDLGTILLKRSSALLEAVEISAERPLFLMDGEKYQYHVQDDPSIQTGTASDALQNAPGVEIDADGNITLRGTQSVEVWINDRPSHMDGEALKQYIKMLPASSIEKIEVISNPSARYGGGTPVVNIITTQKVQRNEFVSIGLNGSSRPDQGIWLSEMKPWVSYVFLNEKFNFNIYANFGYNDREAEYTGSQLMRNGDGDTARVVDYLSQSHTKSIESYIGGHFSYNIDENNSLGAWYGAYPNWRSESQYGRSERFDYLLNGTIMNYTYEGTEDKPMKAMPNGGGYFGGWYQHMIDRNTGHKINFNLNGNGYNMKEFNHHERHYSYLENQDMVRDVETGYKNFSVDFGTDYTLPFGKQDSVTKRFVNELDLGAGYSRNNTRQMSLSSWDQMGYLLGKTDSIDENSFGYTNGLSLYATYQRRIGNLTAKLGVRGNMDNRAMEYFNRPQYDKEVTYFTLTPSFHLSYSTKNMHNFSFSFTRRVDNPRVSQITLYKAYDLDNYGDWGNPDLRASYNQKVELQWDKYFMKFGSIGAQLYYSANKDKVSNLADVIYSDFYGHVVNYSMPMNIGNSWTSGLDLNITCRPSSFINIRFNGSLIYDNEDFTFRDESYQNSQWSYRFRLNAWAKLWKNYQFFVNAHYGSPTKSIFTTTAARKGVDVGVNADFFDRKMTVNLNIHDIFNMNAWQSSNDNPFFSSSSNWKPMSRFITLGITFRFGKMELEGMAQTSGGDSNSSGPSGM